MTKHTLTLLIIVFSYSCGRESGNSTTIDNIYTDTSSELNTTKTGKDTMLDKHTDSIRNEILKCKGNKILKESFLQEMYIRNVVTVSNNSLLFNIPFNLHGPDCSAPDCYTTDVSFSFKFYDTLVFPKSLLFNEYEDGCVDKERHLMGIFQLVEQTEKHVIYHSHKCKRTLVLFSSNKETGTTAFYFTEVKRNRINGENLYHIINDYDEEDKNFIYPFTSWVLTTNEYENFLKPNIIDKKTKVDTLFTSGRLTSL